MRCCDISACAGSTVYTELSRPFVLCFVFHVMDSMLDGRGATN